MGGFWNITNINSEPGKSRWLAKWNLKEMPHINDLNYHNSLTLLVCLCLFTHTIFPPNKYFTCFTSFHICRSSFLQNQRAKALSLTTLLVARVQQARWHDTISISGQRTENPASSCWKLRPLKIELFSRTLAEVVPLWSTCQFSGLKTKIKRACGNSETSLTFC